MSRVLVTGGFGFIGGHLIERILQESDDSIHVVDNLSTSPCPLEYLLDSLSFTSRLTYDICSLADYMGGDPDTFEQVFHLASPVGPAGVLQHGGDMVREVVNDAYLLIDYCLDVGARLLDVSTSEVYGGGQEGYCTESAPKIVPPETTIRLEYAIAKLAAETAIINSHAVKGLDAVIVRPFNVAGPRQSPVGGFVLPRFIRQARAGDPITIFGDGKAVRAFTHVVDLAQGIRLAMESGRSGQAYNLGNPVNKLSISELADRVLSVLGSGSEKRFVDPRTIYGDRYAEANDKFPDARKAIDELGWKPQYDLDAVIRGTYEDVLEQERAGIVVELPS